MKQDRILPGKVSISRPSTGDGREVIRFILRDERSRSIILTFEIEPRELMLAITGLAEQPIGMMWTYLERLGKWMETKTQHIEVVFKPCWNSDFTPAEIMDMLKPFEKDGWKGKASDLNDSRRRVRDGVQAVTFFRWVDKPEEAHAPT